MTDSLGRLRDPRLFQNSDSRGMYALADGFPEQCREALRIAAAVGLGSVGSVTSVVLTGMGGSAAGGDFAGALFDAQGAVPFNVNRGYMLPAWTGAGTLVFATSYSGNTEETLSAYDDARRRGTRLIVVTSGGELARRAERDGVSLVIIPAGQPPRAAMGFMLVPVLVAAATLKLLPPQDISGAARDMEQAKASWRADVAPESNEAKRLAASLHGAVGVIYGLGGWQGVVAQRWKSQINENAKQHVFAHELPEMNHNEILGWEGAARAGVDRWMTLLLEDGHESDRMRLRADVTLEVVREVSGVARVKAPGSSLLSRMLCLALLGDFVSLYLAVLNGVDPGTITSIDLIKERLSRS